MSSLVNLAPSLIVCLTLKKTQNQDADFDGPQILNTSTLSWLRWAFGDARRSKKRQVTRPCLPTHLCAADYRKSKKDTRKTAKRTKAQ